MFGLRHELYNILDDDLDWKYHDQEGSEDDNESIATRGIGSKRSPAQIMASQNRPRELRWLWSMLRL